ncbi:putative uncharacterized protein DDB_G0282129 isoform X2 [Toxorhynchites rutilus septentrionalis]|nr:putative uncharacterized protein DDB_G0282129 isoform X2 [Toxorhynchites rutilus septentrionalis]
MPNSSTSIGGFLSPTQQPQSPPVSGFIQQQLLLPHSQYRGFGGGNCLSNDGSEFASLPPRINNHHGSQQHQQQQQQQQPIGRRVPMQQQQQQQNQSSSFQDLLNSQRIMTDPYINDSSDNESKNSCAKSKPDTAESLLADFNLLNNATVNNGAVTGNGALNGGGGSSIGNGAPNVSSNNLILLLLKEINKLHDTNKKICRNLHETKVEMEALKHTPHWGLSHRRDSISGLSTNSQPVGMRYNSFGLQSPAPTYHSQGNYTPGIVTDVIREIREVSRVREEAMMERMKTMIEERSWALNEANFRLLKEAEETKKSVQFVRSEMNQLVDRMLKLENEVINLKAQLTLQQQQQQQQNFTLRERDSYGQTMNATNAPGSAASKARRNSLHLNYGRINNTDDIYGNNFNDVTNEMRYSNGSNMRKFGENNFGSTVNGGGFGDEMHDDSPNDQVLLLEKDALKIRRELQDALVSRQESESRITALENIVSTLKEQVPTITPLSSQHHASVIQQQLTTPVGLVTSSGSGSGGSSGSSSSNHHHHQQQQPQPQHTNSYFFRNVNSASPSAGGALPRPPSGTSPSLQKAAQIQSLASPSKQYLHLSTSAINVSGPVTDL